MKSPGKATFMIQTLGCKLNQYDSAVIEGALMRRNLSPCTNLGEASIVIVNTCTVTNRADYQSRQLIRKIRRENPSCTIVVTGCYARLAPETLRALPEANIIIDAPDGEAPLVIGRELEKRGLTIVDTSPGESDLLQIHYSGKTRAFLKIQDGCNMKCSYCIIPRVRGKSRSVEPHIVLKDIRKLIEMGYREIVLTGINSGEYGKDLAPHATLFELLREIIAIRDLGRVRLNSLELPTISDDLIDLIASSRSIAHHLHVPLQSGSDRILKLMYRPYRKNRYLQVIETLRKRIPDIGIGADVIVGFPGESEADFQETFDLIKNSPINFLHVFPFSRRPDTPAGKMMGEINGKVLRERSLRLRKLGDELSHSFRNGFHHKVLDAIILEERRKDGLYRSLSGNYIEIGVNALEEDLKKILPVRISRVYPDDTIGKIVRSR